MKEHHVNFHDANFEELCRHVGSKDKDLGRVLKDHGLPPMWTRPATFSTLVLIILEQQVSLASAYAAFRKLKEKLKRVTPQNLLALSDEELRACYFSRQKIGYARGLANAIHAKELQLKRLHRFTDEEVRVELTKLKGVGDWTADVYLIHALQRTDLFPIGDIALVNSMKEIKRLDPKISKEELLSIADKWRPYRTIAAMILWHAYIKKRGIVLTGVITNDGSDFRV